MLNKLKSYLPPPVLYGWLSHPELVSRPASCQEY